MFSVLGEKNSRTLGEVRQQEKGEEGEGNSAKGIRKPKRESCFI